MKDSSSYRRAATTEPANIEQLIALRKTSEAVALEAPGRKALSYRGLCEQVDYVRRMLNDFGLGRSDRIALVLPNGPEMASAFSASALLQRARR